ncbi:MAG TPA: SUMF1/EgtB/PvdO family nonheme iron enzyme [Thermoanaerobaculia bacterium]|nr:SUMF1/EgtB/PvdO family nonheme iron enzyme [Thermoanaerobaculia bacterium]
MSPAKRSAVRNVFLSSTARDLGPYRDAVYKAISGLDGFHCVRMEDFGARDWEADDFCHAKVAECDVFVGLIGHLYGSSPPGSETSFTESEYEAAVAAKIPRLLFMSSDDLPMSPKLREPDALFKRQQQFRERVGKERIVAFFEAPDALATKVIAALHHLEPEKPKTSPRPRKAKSPVDLTQATETYLKYLVERYRYLDFKGLGVSDRVPLRLPLLEMYVPLKARVEAPEGETWDRLRLAGRKPTEAETEALGLRVSEPQPILSLLKKHDGLIVLGDPGSGKSSFLKFLALVLATGQGKSLGLQGRLPVLLPLAAYANVIAEEEIRLDRFIARYYEQRGVDVPLGGVLEQAFKKGSVLLLLDGLDEVRDTSLRNTVVERVRDCYTTHRLTGNKFVITSRIVGYREVRPQAEGLAECTLVDFEDEEIQAFVEKWTAAVERAASGDTKLAELEAQREREELLDAANRNPGVRSLASNPLLLTILAVMKRQGVTLPERRAELYQTYVETLLRSWNLVRSLAGRSTRDLDVVETLKVLAPLALWMHETSPGVGLVKEWDLHRELERIYHERGNDHPEEATRHFMEDVREHAALLLDRGGRQYGFIHLTFQEYLAAVALAQKGQQEIDPIVDALAEHVGEPTWHEVSLLTIGYLGIVQKRDEAASAVVQELISRAPGPPGEAVMLAGRAVADAGAAGVTAACREAVVRSLLSTMTAEGVEARRRAAAGKVLAELGDPRLEVTTLGGMELCLVPAGPFRMGDDKDVHPVEITYDFFLGRYPVTVAQFREYVEASQKQPGNPDCLRGPANVPVGRVSWGEAKDFCAWLTKRWSEVGLLPKGWTVTLPSETEWEKAARGGLEIPTEPHPFFLESKGDAGQLEPNPIPNRRYPWGNDPDPERANYDETGIKEPSAVGCFPRGASPYGCEELSGNVWEWTRSLYEPYPYPPPGTDRERREALDPRELRVLRGGSCFDFSRGVRCAVRNRRDPVNRGDFIGFRVVAAPILLWTLNL